MATKVTKGPKKASAKLFAGSDGKAGKSMKMGPGQSGAGLVGGDSMNHAMGQYGKKQTPAYLPEDAAIGTGSTGQNSMIRGMDGGIRKNARSGGLEGGPMSGPTTPMST